MVVNVSSDGMTEDLWNLAKDDEILLKDLGIKTDRERNLLFYLENFIDDLLTEFKRNDVDKIEVIKKSFEILKNMQDINLTDIRTAVYMALGNKKVAYPNIIGITKQDSKPKRDVDKWIKTLSDINASDNKSEALSRLTEDWDSMEKHDFAAWARYYEHNDHKKYAAEIQPDMEVPEFPINTPKKVKTPDYLKRALISRLDSASRLLREFANVWPPVIWNRLAETLADLQREIVPLKTTATIIDCVVKTANIWNRYGFSEGHDFLIKLAEEPDDVTTQIEKALTGKQFESKQAPADMPTDMSPEATQPDVALPEAAEQPTAPLQDPAAPPAGVEEPLPQPEPPPPVAEPQIEEPKADLDNPFVGKNVSDVVGILEPLLQELNERHFVRTLAKADMMLDGLNIASHFPELSEAQAKALELNLYVGTRIEKIINKLKGGLKEEKEKTAPEVEMTELEQPAQQLNILEQPKAPEQPEQTMFEVTEEPKVK